jgi:hypothetical protein
MTASYSTKAVGVEASILVKAKDNENDEDPE